LPCLMGAPFMYCCQVLEADLQVQLAAPSNDVLASLGRVALHERVRLGKALETLHELGQVRSVLDVNGDLDDGRHTVLHVDEVVCGVARGDGA